MEPEQNGDPLLFDEEHTNRCHERWSKRKNRVWPDQEEEVPDEYYDQCGGCRYYIPLEGILVTDWGVCSNPVSTFDGRVMFEHDGCEHFEGAARWVGAYIDIRKRGGI